MTLIGSYSCRATTSQSPLLLPYHHICYPRSIFHWTRVICCSAPRPLPVSPGTYWGSCSGDSEGDGCFGFNGGQIFFLSLSLSNHSEQYYAALNEWRTGEQKSFDFTSNTYLEAYTSHIVSLDEMEQERKPTFRSTMANIYELAV